MNPTARLQAVYAGGLPDRVPFVPVIREHAAGLIGRTPSDVARSADRMVEAQLAAWERYRPDMLSLGVDTYNLEAEALGAAVAFPDDAGTPVLRGPLLADKARLSRLAPPDPARDGRLPLILAAGTRLRQAVGDTVSVNATVAGPFTLAAQLRGFEALILDVHDDPEFVRELLRLTTAVGQRYGEALIAQALSVSISESWIAPPLLSPALYRTWALPPERELIAHLRRCGQAHTALISGGDTIPILEDLLTAGASLLVADFAADLARFKPRAAAVRVVTRGNVDPKLLESGPVAALREATARVLEVGKAGGYFVFGTGIVPFGTPPAHLVAVRTIVEELGGY
jgi:uroporphyrinogen decarboxylase